MPPSPPQSVTVNDLIAADSACTATTNWDVTDFQHLLAKGWDINHNFGHAGNALTLAASGNKLPAINFHLSHGANPNLGRWGGFYTPLELASMFADVSVVATLLAHGATASSGSPGGMAMLQAARRGRVDVMEALLGAGCGVDEVPGRPDLADNERMRADFGTPLHGAAGYGRLDAVRWLLRRGAGRGVRNPRGLTAGEVAREKGFGDCEELLR